MSLKIEKPTQKEFKLVSKGTQIARLIQIIDLGVQDVEWQGQIKQQPKVRFTWELPNETSEFDGVMKPMVIGQDYTLSMGSKSNLRPVVEALINAQLKDEEAYNFDMDSFRELLGKPCMLQVIHKVSSKGNTYANVGSVLPMMKGVEVPPQFNESTCFEIENATEEQFAALPKFIQEKIAKSRQSKSGISDDEVEILNSRRNAQTFAHNKSLEDSGGLNPEDIPF